MFASVCEEAATLVLTREHFVDFFDFDISEVVFLCEAECPQLWLSSKMYRTVRGVAVWRQVRTAMIYISGEGMSRYTGYMNG